MNWQIKNFSPSEVLSPDGLSQLSKSNLMLDYDSLKLLDQLRNRINMPLICNFTGHNNRGYRSISENKLADGGDFSRHVQGKAFDLHCKLSPLQLAVEAILIGFTGIGIYNTFTHIDTRNSLDSAITVWRGQETKRIILTTDNFNKEFLSKFLQSI